MRLNRSKIIIFLTLITADIGLIFLALISAYNLRFFSFLTSFFPVTKGIPAFVFYQHAALFIVPLWIFIFFRFNFYKTYFIPALDEIIRTVQAVTIGIVFLILATFFYREFSFSRLVFFVFWATSILYIFAFREVFKLIFRGLLRNIIGRESILVVGKENEMLKIVLKRNPHLQVYYSPYDEESHIEKIKNTVSEKKVNQVILTKTNWSENALLSMYDWCESASIDLKFVPDIVQLCRGEISIDSSLGIPIFHLKSVSLNGFNFIFKRIFDVFASSLILILLSPLLGLIAVLIKFDSQGPSIYSHKRMGYRGQTFNFYKFRTMVQDADAQLEKFKAMSERQGPVFKMSNDPRITKIGKFLRKYSIDELPQLINVLKGDMSLVGPRPQVLWEAAAYDDWAKRRLRILPGITGLWQISGRASLSYEEMIELDIFYIENWSLGLDLKILFMTLPAIFGKKGAY